VVTRVLVTGGAGYIGSHACKALAQAGFEPVCLDSLERGHRAAVRWGPFVHGDLGDAALVERVLRESRVAAVMHFAAYAYVGESMRQPGRYFRNNVGNALHLLEAMRGAGVRHFVFSSTCATYGLPQALPIREDHPQQPVNPYGESKLFVERALRWHGVAHDLRWMALRYFNAAGADPDGELGEEHEPETHLMPLALETALGRRAAVDLLGTDYATRDGTAVRDYVHVTDLADAHVLALRHLLDGGASEALNLGTGRGHSVLEVLAAVQRAAGRPVATRLAPRRAGDPAELYADPSRARQLLGWEPRLSDLDTLVATAWHWHRDRLPQRRQACA
jgi:UDP-arabinose 4-epimerase